MTLHLEGSHTMRRPVIVGGDIHVGSKRVQWHSHRRGQLLYAGKGTIILRTAHGAWVAPPERAVWMPGGVSHSSRLVAANVTRHVMLEPGVAPQLDVGCRVVAVSPLLRALLLSAIDVSQTYDLYGRDAHMMALILAEMTRAPSVALAVPFPRTALLAEKCQAFFEDPNPHENLDEWSAHLNVSRRTLSRLFRSELSMSFGEWRQRATILISLPRLAAGDAVATIAADLGYDSPAAFATMFKRILGIAPSQYPRE